MSQFLIQSHGRLQEWVAEEKGYFKDEGLDYEFIVKPIATWSGHVQSTESAPIDMRAGAFESYEQGRGCNLSAACHWTVGMAASGMAGCGVMPIRSRRPAFTCRQILQFANRATWPTSKWWSAIIPEVTSPRSRAWNLSCRGTRSVSVFVDCF